MAKYIAPRYSDPQLEKKIKFVGSIFKKFTNVSDHLNIDDAMMVLIYLNDECVNEIEKKLKNHDNNINPRLQAAKIMGID